MGHKTRLHFPQQAPPPPFTFAVKAQDLYGKSVSYGGLCGKMYTSRHTLRQGGLTSDMGENTSTHHKKTHRLLDSEYFSVILVVLVL